MSLEYILYKNQNFVPDDSFLVYLKEAVEIVNCASGTSVERPTEQEAIANIKNFYKKNFSFQPHHFWAEMISISDVLDENGYLQWGDKKLKRALEIKASPFFCFVYWATEEKITLAQFYRRFLRRKNI